LKFQGIFGGALLGVRSTRFICLYDWEKLSLIRRIEVVPKAIYWSESGKKNKREDSDMFESIFDNVCCLNRFSLFVCLKRMIALLDLCCV
jgi:hypothetical protein